MYTGTAGGQAVLPRFNTPNYERNQQIMTIVNNAISGVTGGVNYRISAGVFSLKNTTTGLYNREDAVNADGAQAIVLSNGVA